MRGAITAAAASPTANGGASDKPGTTCATCGHCSRSSSSSSSDGRKWQGRRKVGLPVTLATALAVVLLLVLGVLDLEGGFVGDHLRSSVLEQVAAAAFPAGAGGTEEESRSGTTAAAAAAAGVDPEGELVDWPRCLAKTQHLVYRKAALRFPTPPRLRRLFADYEAMHRRCTVGKDWDREARAILGQPEGGDGDRDHDQRGGRRRLMADTQAQAQSSSASADAVDANRTQQQQTDSDDKCQYLFIQMDPGSGLGNRLLGIVSGFLYALITNRALLTDPNEDVWHLLCDPFYNSSWFLPNTFPVQMVTNVSREMKDAADQDLSTADIVTVRLKHVVEPTVQRFWCSQTQEQLQAVKWILWRSNQHLVPRFFATPHFWPRLHAMFLAGPPDDNAAAAADADADAAGPAVDPSKMFLHLSRHLILPRNSLWKRILRLYWAEMADAKTVVGVQIRRHGSVKKLFSVEVHQRMMECLVGQRLLPNTTTTSDDQSDDDDGDRPDSNSSAATVQRLTAQMRRVLPAAGRPATPVPRAANNTTGSSDWDSEPSSSRWEVVRPTLLLPATTHPPPPRRPFLRWPSHTQQRQQQQQPTETTVLMETRPQNVAADTAAAAGPGRPIVVLIASLRADYWDEMKAQYTAHPTADGSLVRVLQVTHDTNQRQSLAQMGDALVEMWLLSFADHLVISSWSTFGYVPIGLSGITGAYIMNVRGEQLRPEPACTRWRTSDPCNHFPFFDKAACPSSDAMMSPEQQAWMGQRIGPCETRTGIQLI